MAKAQEFVLPTQAAWNAICRLRIARENVKSWLTNAEEELKDARREIDELGVRGEDSKEFSDAAARKERAERQRDALKERLKTLANKIDTAVEDAAKGNEKLFDDIDWKSLESKPTAKELYHAEDDESQMEIGQGEKKVKPIGRPGPVKPEHPAAEMGDGYAEHLKVSVLELDLPEKLKGKLQRDGFETVGSVIAAIDKEGYTNPKNDAFRELFNASSKDAEAIVEAAWAFKKKHVKAELDKIREEENGPSAGGLGRSDSGGVIATIGTAANAKPGKGAGKKKGEAIL